MKIETRFFKNPGFRVPSNKSPKEFYNEIRGMLLYGLENISLPIFLTIIEELILKKKDCYIYGWEPKFDPKDPKIKQEFLERLRKKRKKLDELIDQLKSQNKSK